MTHLIRGSLASPGYAFSVSGVEAAVMFDGVSWFNMDRLWKAVWRKKIVKEYFSVMYKWHFKNIMYMS